MIDGCEKHNRELAFELQNSHVCEKCSNFLFGVSFLYFHFYDTLNIVCCNAITTNVFWALDACLVV